jgi:thymidylate kinase
VGIMIRKTFENRRPRLVSFSGIDGSGKSTQIEALRVRLNEIGQCVLLVTFWNDVARLTQIREVSGQTLFKGEKGVGTPTRPINRRDKNVRSWCMTAVRFGLYFVDAISLRIVVEKALRADADVVIFDRYHYDELANLGLSSRIVRVYVRLLLRLVPQPDISFLLDADPIQARARKPEYPLDFLYKNRASYLALGELAGMTIIAPQPVHDVEREVLQQVLKKLSPEALRSRQAEQLAGGKPGATAQLDPSTALGADSGEVRPFTV